MSQKTKNKSNKPAQKSSAQRSSAQKSGAQKSSASKASQKHDVKHHRSTVLTIALVFMAVHGIAAAIAYGSMTGPENSQRPVAVAMMMIHFLLNIAAAVGIFYWKKWGIYVYVASTFLAVAAGLLALGPWSVFYMLIPLLIFGYLLRNYWGNFE
jgi:hypothetical protein